MMGPMLRYRLFSLLPKISMFGALSRDDVDFFVRPLRGQKVEADEILFREGDSPGDFYLLLIGEIDLEVRGRKITTLGEGDLLGAEAPIGIQSHSLTAVARTACIVLVIPPRSLHRLSKENPTMFGMLMNNIARDFARRLSGMSLFAGSRPQAGSRTTPAGRGPSLPATGDAGFHYPITKPWPRLGRDLW